jgi:hypothetical protein
MIKRVKPKLSDFSNEKWALFPGNNLKRAPISFLDYLRDDEESISLKLFAT